MFIGAGMQVMLGFRKKKCRKYLGIIFGEISRAQLQSTGECGSSDETDPHGAVWAHAVHVMLSLLPKTPA